MPAIATTVILNFIQLWNEFLFAGRSHHRSEQADAADRYSCLYGRSFPGHWHDCHGGHDLCYSCHRYLHVLLGKTYPRHDVWRSQIEDFMAVVTLEKVSKRYAGVAGPLAVDNVDLNIADGEFMVLLGPSGLR